MLVYQVWLLADDLNYAQEHQQDLADAKVMESEDKDVAMWFALNYKFNYVENTIVVVEEVGFDSEGNEECVDRVMEFPLTKD